MVTAQVQWVAAELLDFPVRWPVCAKFAAGLLTNILYTGAIRHKGQAYPASTPPFLNHGTWERVQNLIAHPAAVAPGKPRNKHLALLSGLLYYEFCSTRMIYSYSWKGGRRQKMTFGALQLPLRIPIFRSSPRPDAHTAVVVIRASEFAVIDA